jgi:hypothetical protein
MTVYDGRLELSQGTTAAVAIPGPLTVGSTNMALSPVVRLLKADQIADSAAVTVHPNGALEVNNQNESLNSLNPSSDCRPDNLLYCIVMSSEASVF